MGMLRNWADGLLSALGGSGRPNGPAGLGYCHMPMSDQEIDARFQGSWLARKIVTKPATEITREGRDWQAPKEVIEKIEAEEKRLGLKAKLQLAETLRGLGGAGMVLYIASDADQMAPLDPKRIAAGGLTNVFVWHQSRFTLGPVIDGDWADPFFGHPAYYEMQGVGTGLTKTTRFHPTRVVAFRGKPSGGMLTSAVAMNRWWWGDSVVEITKEAVDNVHTGEKGFAKLIRRSAIRRLSVPKLFEKVATADSEANFAKRVAAIAAGESSDDITWLDGGDGEGKGAEEIKDAQVTWAGIPDIKASNLMVAAAAACIPATVLLEKAPDGQNATGDGDNRNWEKEVKARQDLEHRPCLDQLDVALIPSALGKVDPSVWWVFAPLSTPTEKEVAETFKLLMEAVTALQATGLLPEEALSRAVQNLLEERGDLPGLSEALALIPEEERFPSRDVANDNPDVTDPSALTQGGPKGGDPRSAGGGGDGSALARRAANDARFADAAPRTLYVQRKLLNTAEFIAWAKSQGFETTTPADDLHVTITYSRQPVDWMKMGATWEGDDKGNLTVAPGGARIIEPLGDKGAVVLLFASSALSWRHEEMIRNGASHDFDEYQPHVTITYTAPEGLDLSKVEPFRGALKFGPEIFEELNLDWTPGAA